MVVSASCTAAFHVGNRASNPLGDAMQKKEGRLVSRCPSSFCIVPQDEYELAGCLLFEQGDRE